MSNGRSETYQLEGFETVAGDQTLRSQYSIIPENMRDEIENREVWNSIGDVGEGLGNILTGTAEGFGYDLSSPGSLLADLALTMFLPPTLRNAAKGVKRTKKSLNPYQKIESTSKQLEKGTKAYVDAMPIPKIDYATANRLPASVPRTIDRVTRPVDAMPVPMKSYAKYGENKELMDMVYGRPPIPGVPMQSNNTKKLLPLLLAMGNKSSEGNVILDELLREIDPNFFMDTVDTEPIELKKPNFQEKILEMLMEDSKWRY